MQTIEAQGLRVKCQALNGEWFLVPRIYIAVHGLRSSEISVLARRHHWKPTSPPREVGTNKKRRTWKR